MLDRFESGKGGVYTSNKLTNIVANNNVTQKYMSDITKEFEKNIVSYSSDFKNVKNIIESKINFQNYSYGGGLFDKETYKGLTIDIHG